MTDGEQGLRARQVALSILSGVLERKQPLDDILEPHSKILETRDRAFVRSLVGATLRRLLEIDGHIDRCLNHPLPKEATRVRHFLRLGLAQLIFLEVPAHAAVDTTMRLADADSSFEVRRLKPLINAVLRRIARERPAPLSPAEAGVLNTPAWLCARWRKAYGPDRAQAMAAAHMTIPPLDITLKREEDAAIWADRLEARILPTGSLRRRQDGRIADLPGYGEGAWWIQDAAAALPVRLAGDVTGRAAIDLCAAPGGKAAQLAARGAMVTAVDKSAARMVRLKENIARLGLAVTLIEADAAVWRPPVPAGVVLLDAPCSSTGTIRRHPDIPHTKTAAVIAALAELQSTLLDAAAAMVAPGGMLIYCTCSLEPEEGEAQAARFLNAYPDFHRRPILPHELPGLADAVTDEGDAWVLPSMWASEGGIDGFFITRLERRI